MLTITGRVERTNVERTVRLDEDGLDSLGRVRIELYQPWVKQRMSFQGVWLADVLAATGIDNAAASVHLTALDNYQVDIPITDVRAGGVLLATRTGDGGRGVRPAAGHRRADRGRRLRRGLLVARLPDRARRRHAQDRPHDPGVRRAPVGDPSWPRSPSSAGRWA